MQFTGLITKMISENNNPIQYFLNFGDDIILMNQLIGKQIRLKFNSYSCLNCCENKEIFAMGLCKNCYFTSPHAGKSILRPELSKAHLGIADRDLEFEQKLQLQPHIVYLANTGDIKVGVTRKTQIPTRWIDQGAEFVIKLAEVENRYLAGLIEVELKKVISDKTNYRKMLSSSVKYIDLAIKKSELLKYIPKELKSSILEDNEVTELHYPINNYPLKITSVSLKKELILEGILMGIKGQYLMFNNNKVINIRNHEGFYHRYRYFLI